MSRQDVDHKPQFSVDESAQK